MSGWGEEGGESECGRECVCACVRVKSEWKWKKENGGENGDFFCQLSLTTIEFTTLQSPALFHIIHNLIILP